VIFCYNENMKAKIIILVIVSLIILAFANHYFEKNQGNLPKMNQNTQKIVEIGGITLNVEVADTDVARIQGLSGRKSLGKNEGMLFVFEDPGNYGFWMKDMNFAIDIAWLDKDKKIIYIENNVEPETYLKNPPQIFGSDVTSLYVLETPAQFLVENNVKIGDFVAF
jgi:uncharacterized protein